MKLLELYINSRIKKYDIISFDIFDTLIHRKTKLPMDIFSKVERKLREQGFDEDFKERRIIAEQKARKTSGKYIEIGIDDIYRFYEYHEVESSKLMKMELEEELNNIYPDKRTIEILKKAVRNGKRIILISDMYLSKDFIKVLLEKCDCVLYDQLYLSSEIGLTKARGKLYEYVQKREKGRILHIGDNYYSDYKIPKSYGIAVIWLVIPHIKRILSKLIDKVRG